MTALSVMGVDPEPLARVGVSSGECEGGDREEDEEEVHCGSGYKLGFGILRRRKELG